MEYIPLLLTGAAGAAAVKLLDNVVMWVLGRRAKRTDAREDDLKALTDGVQVILFDRIQYLGRAYIRDGAVSFDDRCRLHKMHDKYHNLGGNGDLDSLMVDVDELPLN